MAIVDAQRLVTRSGEVVGVTAKLRTPQRLDFKSTKDLTVCLAAGARENAGEDAAGAESEQAVWEHAACQDYLFSMAMKSKVYRSFAEAVDDFARWGLDVLWGEDVPTHVATVRKGHAVADQ